MSRTAAAIDRAAAAGRSAFIGYLPAGYPDKEQSIAAAIALAENGADVIEIGIPYSDPVMDGPVIQQATTEVLARGFRISEVFEIVQAVVEATDAAVLVMTYYNIIDRMGTEEFARRLAAAGGAGAITPDLIPDEAAEWIAAADAHDLDRVFLSAPTSNPERVAMIAQASRGFVYGVSLMGVTGTRDAVSDAAVQVVEASKAAGEQYVTEPSAHKTHLLHHDRRDDAHQPAGHHRARSHPHRIHHRPGPVNGGFPARAHRPLRHHGHVLRHDVDDAADHPDPPADARDHGGQPTLVRGLRRLARRIRHGHPTGRHHPLHRSQHRQGLRRQPWALHHTA